MTVKELAAQLLEFEWNAKIVGVIQTSERPLNCCGRQARCKTCGDALFAEEIEAESSDIQIIEHYGGRDSCAVYIKISEEGTWHG